MKTFGPIVIHENNGDIRGQCAFGGHYCNFYSGGFCRDAKPPRHVPDHKDTPDWCAFKSDMLRDAQTMADMDRLGITKLSRPELQARCRDLPKEFRPAPLGKARKPEMQNALLAHHRSNQP